MSSINEFVELVWYDMFAYGTSFYPSLYLALIANGVTSTLVLFFPMWRGEPLINPANILKKISPIPPRRERELSVKAVHKPVLAIAISLQVFFKIGIVDSWPEKSSIANLLLIAHWLVGAYFLAGWIWIIKSCAPWKHFC